VSGLINRQVELQSGDCSKEGEVRVELQTVREGGGVGVDPQSNELARGPPELVQHLLL
jgi:hypothetical protein